MMNAKRSTALLLVVAAVLLAFVGTVAVGLASLAVPAADPTPTTAVSSAPTVAPSDRPTATAAPTDGLTIPDLEVRFLDVGQADSILIRAGDHAMLIDAGNNKDGKGVVAYLKSLGIERLDAIVGTHPHEDHIGGMDKVIEAFEIGRAYLPDATNNTTTFYDVLDALAARDLRLTTAKAGMTFLLGDAEFTVLSPAATSYDEMNLHSIVLRMTYGERTFLFCGDAESDNESEMLASGRPLSADVLKVAHHGSTTSSTVAFLRAVAPRVAVITVGSGNSFDHPAPQTLDRLAALGTTVYRTDLDGTVVVRSDGTSLDVSFESTGIDG